MANILKLQDQLKGLPDKALISYAQNPTGQVPQYLVLSELQRRKSMREEYQQSQAQQPQTTVAQDLTQPQGIQQLQPQAQPQQQMQPQPAASQGVANLPIPDTMFQEQSMAGGGIVAFDEGGSVPGYANGDLIKMPSQLDTNYSQVIEGYKAAIPRLLAKARSGAQLAPNELQIIKFLQDQGKLPFSAAAFFTAEPQIPAYVQNKIDALTPASTTTPAGEKQVTDFGGLANMVSDLPSATLPPYGGLRNLVPPPPPPAPNVPGINLNEFKGAFGTPKSAYDNPEVRKQLEALRAALPTPSKTDFVGETPTVEKAIQQQQDFNKAFGVSEKPYEQQAERLSKQEGKLSEQKQTAGWLALAQAGFAAAAGSSPYALKNIAEGGSKGLAEYTNSIEKLQAREDRLNEARFNLEDAQNKFRQTGSQAAAANYDRRLTEYNQANRDYVRLENDNARTQRGIDERLFTGEVAERSATDRAKLEIRAKEVDAALRKAGVDLQAFDAKNRADMQRYLMKNPDWDKRAIQELSESDKWKNATGEQRARMIVDIISDVKRPGDSTLRSAIGKDYNRALESAKITNSEYKKALKNKDTETIKRIETDIYNSVAKGYGGRTSGAVSFNDLPD